MLKRIGSVLLIIALLSGCSNGTFDKAMEQGKLALANGEYDKALTSMELALEEKPDNREAISIKRDIKEFNLLRNHMKAEEWEAALNKAEVMLRQDYLAIGLREQVENLVNTVKTNQQTSAKVAAHMKEIETSVEAGELEEAQQTIDELRKNQDSIDQLGQKLADLEKRLEIEMKKEQAQPVIVQNPASKPDAIPNTVGQQKQYRNKLNAIEAGLIDLDYLYTNGITAEISEAESERYKRWDHVLNEIYGVLKKQLSKQDMEQLRIKQRQWIKYRDRTASANAAEFGEGSFGPVTHTSTSADLTKERCYALVDLYMN